MPIPAILGALTAARVAHGIWSASKHPRGQDGRFVSTGRFSYRVSTRSATVHYGHTFPIIPGKANLYVGALARVERNRGHETAVEKKLKARGRKITSQLPAKVQSVLSKGGYETPGGTTIRFNKPKVRQPTIRASKGFRKAPTHTRVGKARAKMPITGGATGVHAVRSPNRKARTRSITPATVTRPAITKATGKKVKK